MTRRARRAAWLLGLAPALAAAQWGGSVLVESDQRFRGISLSDGDPSARITLSYDHAGGAYAGLSASRYRIAEGGARASLIGYAGFVAPAAERWHWDAGLTYTAVEHRHGDAWRYDYGELHAGLVGERFSVRVYASPHYFGFDPSVYAELGTQWPLARDWRLALHAGALLSEHDDARADARIGLVWHLRGFDLQLAWTGVQDGGPPPRNYDGPRQRWVLSAACAF